MIDTSAAVQRHVCEEPPQILGWEYPAVEEDCEFRPPPNFWMAHAEGTRHICEGCGRVRVVTWVDGYEGANIVVMGRWEWVDETRRQRRQRLGLRWWQRG